MKRNVIIEKNKDFSVKFSNRLMQLLITNAEQRENIALSPSRLQTILIILANWAQPSIQKQILEVFGIDVMDINEANILFNKERLTIKSFWEEDDDYAPHIEQTLFLWLKKSFSFNERAISVLSDIYNVILRRVDFQNPTTKTTIDKTIEQATHGLYKRMESKLDPLTQILITDVLYFKAKWETQFDSEVTKDRFFYGTYGKTKIPMMKHRGFMPYCETPTCQIIQLHYQCSCKEERSFSMRIYLPKKGCTHLQILKEVCNNDYSLNLKEQDVKLTLPRFSVTSNVDMHKLLYHIGLGDIYETTDIIPKLVKNIKLEVFLQQTKIKVNEDGSEAVALTILCDGGCLPPPESENTILMKVNHPFIFEIAEDFSNTILFTGLVNNIE